MPEVTDLERALQGRRNGPERIDALSLGVQLGSRGDAVPARVPGVIALLGLVLVLPLLVPAIEAFEVRHQQLTVGQVTYEVVLSKFHADVSPASSNGRIKISTHPDVFAKRLLGL